MDTKNTLIFNANQGMVGYPIDMEDTETQYNIGDEWLIDLDVLYTVDFDEYMVGNEYYEGINTTAFKLFFTLLPDGIEEGNYIKTLLYNASKGEEKYFRFKMEPGHLFEALIPKEDETTASGITNQKIRIAVEISYMGRHAYNSRSYILFSPHGIKQSGLIYTEYRLIEEK